MIFTYRDRLEKKKMAGTDWTLRASLVALCVSTCVKNPGVEWDPGTCENVIVSGNSLVNEE